MWFTHLQRLQFRDEGFLNKLATRVNTLEAEASLVTSDTKRALNGVNDLNIERDGKLRVELDVWPPSSRTTSSI